MKQLFCIALIICSFVTQVEANQVEDALKHLSMHEKVCMRKFFDFAIKMDGFAHVVCFDNKPVCLSGVIVKSNLIPHQCLLCLKGWKYFKRHDSSFPHPKFLISEELRDWPDFKVLHIYFINKPALFKCLQEYNAVFSKELGSQFTPQWFLSELELGTPLTQLIDHSDYLLGILLGYGEESSRAYDTAHKLNQTPPHTETYQGITIQRPKGCKIYPFGFMGNPNSSEVKELVSMYEAELEEIWELYHTSKDPLKVILEKLCEESTDLDELQLSA